MKPTNIPVRHVAAVVCAIALAGMAWAETPQQMIETYLNAAGSSTASAAAGKTLFTTPHTGGKPDTPTCITCHGTDLTQAGRTRAGKPIEPMASSANPKRFTDPAQLEKWFGRNCNSVMGRDCTAQEKADVIAYLSGL